jgi:hypothetical protein
MDDDPTTLAISRLAIGPFRDRRERHKSSTGRAGRDRSEELGGCPKASGVPWATSRASGS